MNAPILDGTASHYGEYEAERIDGILLAVLSDLYDVWKGGWWLVLLFVMGGCWLLAELSGAMR